LPILTPFPGQAQVNEWLLCCYRCLRCAKHSAAGVWSLKATDVLRKKANYTSDPDVYHPQLFFVLYLQRKPFYYLLQVTLPCFFITFIALLVCHTTRTVHL